LETLAATARLVTIDANKERAYNIRGISLLKNRRLEEATSVLDEYLSRFGQSGVILCNLAKVWDARQEHRKAEELLWKSLTVDPNQDNALIWWGAIHRERAGEDGFYAAMTEASGIPGSWRPQLWLARRALEKNDASGALAYYDAILSTGNLPGDALMSISGDLGNSGLGAESVRLLGTLYNPAKHGHLTGLNLIMTYIQLKRKKDGYALLAQLRNLKRHDITKHLDALEKQLNELSDVAYNS
jgi:tetratricopeptide (TPR) repeat protein